MSTPAKTFGGGCVLVGAAIFWSSLTLLFDGLILYGLASQIGVESYRETPGVLTRSAVKIDADAEGATYSLDVEYRYEVGGKQLVGTRTRWFEFSSSDRWPQKWVAEHPVGGKVPVYYDALDPSKAVLLQGVQGSDLMMLLFITPFNVVMVCLWHWVLRGDWRSKLTSARLRETNDGVMERLRVGGQTPAAALAITLLAAPFVLMFALGFSVGFSPPVRLMYLVWAGVLTLAIGVYYFFWLRVRSGFHDLAFNSARQSLTLPRGLGLPQAVEVPIRDIRSLHQEQVVNRDSDGTQTTAHSLLLSYRNATGEEREVRLFKSPDAAGVAAVELWVRARAALPRVDQTAGEPAIK